MKEPSCLLLSLPPSHQPSFHLKSEELVKQPLTQSSVQLIH